MTSASSVQSPEPFLAEAAAVPLTAITAWETLFDRLDIRKRVPGAAHAMLIIGGAGGVGSMAIQLARALSDVTVIGTASRDETRDWVKALGAHYVLDHSKPLAAEVKRLDTGAPGFVFSTTRTDAHFDEIAELIAPQGRLALIDDPEPIDVRKLKRKSVSLHWELMFTRSMFTTEDMAQQHELLAAVSALLDQGRLEQRSRRISGPSMPQTSDEPTHSSKAAQREGQDRSSRILSEVAWNTFRVTANSTQIRLTTDWEEPSCL